MIELLTFWFMFPVALLISTVALMFGIGGAVFFSPVFLILLGLEPRLAISLGILIEVFGFTSGLIGYAKRKLINYHLSSRILPFVLISAVAGAILGKIFPPISLEILLATLILFLGIISLKHDQNVKYLHYPLHHFLEERKEKNGVDREKISWFDFWKDFKQKPTLFITSALGGLFLGLTSAGLGEINAYTFVKKLKMEIAFSAGSSVLIIATSAIFVSLFNISYFSLSSPQEAATILQIALFAIPGVVIGGQLGPMLSRKIDRQKALRILPLLFISIALVTFIKALL